MNSNLKLANRSMADQSVYSHLLKGKKLSDSEMQVAILRDDLVLEDR